MNERLYRRKKIEYSINENGCHICTSHFLNGGYPVMNRNHKKVYMSHYIWEQKNGPIPEGLYVCHKCDTPSCINIDHFFLGTKADNIHDMNNKGRARHPRGMEHSAHKLTEKQVLEIREATGTHRKIASQYGIVHSVVTQIKNRKVWGWL